MIMHGLTRLWIFVAIYASKTMCNKLTALSSSPVFPEQTVYVSKLEVKETGPFKCDCDEVKEEVKIEIECRCYGKELVHIPTDLNKTLDKLIITDADIRYIRKSSLNWYRESLKDIHFINLPQLRVIEEGTFADIPNLRTIYMSNVPQLKFVQGLLVGVTSVKFLSLRIIHTGLHEVPDLFHLPSKNTLFLLDLDHNKIETLPANSIKINAEQVTLNFNEILSVEDYAFNGSQIGKLNIRGNYHLTHLGSKAFEGLRSLRELDLSQTAIENLPVIGLGEIETLRIEQTPSMKTIPSIYDLRNLKVAKLTHPFHCCAFKYPEQHNPRRHAAYEERFKKMCKESVRDTGQDKLKDKDRTKREINNSRDSWDAISDNSKYDMSYENAPKSNIKAPFNFDGFHQNPIQGEPMNHEKAKPIEMGEDIGYFHSHSAKFDENKSVVAFCGHLSKNMPDIKCTPEPNALNPCEDIMGSSWLRVSVWFVVVLAVLGNSAVIIVVVFSGGEVTVPRFLICNLAIADFCMGLYLLLIASMDLHSVKTYFNFAFNWQYGLGCQMAGFLTVFASHLSIFTLTVVTIERWFAITYAINLTRRLRIGAAVKTMFCGWIYSMVIAALPLLGVSNYSSTSICLPMEVNRTADKAYLYMILIINGVAFALIVFCYAQIYLSLGYETRRMYIVGEMTIAKKMALLVFTDFATWAPIAFFGLTALAGYPLIGVPRSKILLVFFYPLNACANPYLYALMTAQYRKDFFMLVSKCGFCKRRAKHYAVTTNFTLNNTNNTSQLVAKSNGQCLLPKTKESEDTFV